MKKILMVAWESLGKGGIQSVLMNIVRGLHSDFVFDVILFTEKIGFYEDEFKSYGGKIFRLKHYNGENKFLSRADIYFRCSTLYNSVRRIMSENGPYDAIHCNNGFESGVYIKAAYAESVPIRIVHSHSVINDSGFLRTIYNNYFGNIIKHDANQKIACSDIAGRSLFGEEKFRVINNPYDETMYFYSESGAESGNLSLCQVGRLCDIKNQIFSLNVVAEIKKKGIDIIIRFVGKDYDDYRARMIEFIRENDLESNVEFYPEDTDIPALYRKSTYVIFPSTTEGFGMVPVEAQAMGIKCFVSDKVPKETDCGGCVYLSLSDVQVWVDEIISEYNSKNKKRIPYDCSGFSLKELRNQYRYLYLSSINI